LAERPVRNVVLIVSDTLRRDHVGCYRASHVRTPHLTRFAERCAVFEQAYSGSFPTVPTRNDLLTGRYTFTYKPWAPLAADDRTLPELLREAGVATGLVVDTPHPFTPGFNYQRGFESWEVIRGQEHDEWKPYPRHVELPCAPEKLRNPHTTVVQYLRNVHDRRRESDYFVAQTMQRAAEWVEHMRQVPFFLYVDTFDPHEPWDPPRHYVDLYDPGYAGEEVIYPRYDRSDYLSEAELGHCRALYAGEVTMVDRWVGHLLDRIESLGLMDQTAVFFLSDHGFYLGDRGYIGKTLIRGREHQPLPLYPEICHIPLLAYLPGSRARRVADLAQPVDLMATVLDLFGVARPASVQGRSLYPLLAGRGPGGRDLAVASPTIAGPHLDATPAANLVTATDGRWLLIFGPSVAPGADGGAVTAMVDGIGRRLTFIEPPDPAPRLYDLAADTACERNVAAERSDVADRLRREFVGLLEASGVADKHRDAFQAFAAGAG
jgi:arylsulfatase A-like enzyme